MDALLVIASKYSNILPLLPLQNLVTSFPLKNSVCCTVRGCQRATPCGLCGVLSLGILGVPGLSEKVGLKLNIQKTKIMASGPICHHFMANRWQTMETVTDFIFLGSKIPADGDYSHEIKRRLLLGRKVMTNLDSMLKSRDITLPTKVRLVKTRVFPVVMNGCESWTIKKAEC